MPVGNQTQMLPICCVCGLIREEEGGSPIAEHWITKQAYRETHGVDPGTCRLTHTYCPTCYSKFMNQIAAA